MEVAFIITELAHYIRDKSSGYESIAIDMLKVAVDKLGTRHVAEMISHKIPVGSKTDDFFMRWREEEYQKEVDKFEIIIKKIIE